MKHCYNASNASSIKVNPSIVSRLEEHGMMFVGHDVDGKRMEILELQGMQINFTMFHVGFEPRSLGS